MSLIIYQCISKWHEPQPTKIKKIEKAYLDGYFISQHLLEGYQFWFKVTEDGNDIDVWIDDISLSYMKDDKMDIEKWKKKAKNKIIKCDCFSTEDNGTAFIYNTKKSKWFDEQKFEIVE